MPTQNNDSATKITVGRLHEVEWGQNRRAKEDITYLGPLRAELGLGFRPEEAGQLRRGQRVQRDTEEGRRRIVPRRRPARRQPEEGVAPAGGARRREGGRGEGSSSSLRVVVRAGRRPVSARLASSRLLSWCGLT